MPPPTRRIPPTWKPSSSFSPILAEADDDDVSSQQQYRHPLATCWSIDDSSGDILSLGTPLSASSPTSIAAVAPPPSPKRRGTNYVRQQPPARAAQQQQQQQQQEPPPPVSVSYSRTDQHATTSTTTSTTTTSLEQRLFRLPARSTQSATAVRYHRVVVQGKSVEWTGELHEGLPTGAGKLYLPDGQVCTCVVCVIVVVRLRLSSLAIRTVQ